MPIQNLIEFILFIIPGFIYVQTFRKFHPAEKESHFSEVANTTIFGVLKYIIDGIGVYLNIRDINRIEFVKGV